MVKQMYIEEYGVFGGFVILSIVFAFAAIFTSFLVRAKAPYKEKNSTYECGVRPDGDAQIKFPIKYYMTAILFIVFEVEAVFILPWAVYFKKLGLAAFVSGVVFVFILFLGWGYAMKRDFFDYKK